MIREREFIRCKEQVYKVGMTVQCGGAHRISRFQAYKKGSELIFLWQCIDEERTVSIETRIKDKFNKLFQRHYDGYEYFKGNRFNMVNTMMGIIMEINNEKVFLHNSS